MLSAQNGVGSEEIIAELTRGYVIRATTFMSGTRHSDTHVQYELDTPTWMGRSSRQHAIRRCEGSRRLHRCRWTQSGGARETRVRRSGPN